MTKCSRLYPRLKNCLYREAGANVGPLSGRPGSTTGSVCRRAQTAAAPSLRRKTASSAFQRRRGDGSESESRSCRPSSVDSLRRTLSSMMEMSSSMLVEGASPVRFAFIFAQMPQHPSQYPEDFGEGVDRRKFFAPRKRVVRINVRSNLRKPSAHVQKLRRDAAKRWKLEKSRRSLFSCAFAAGVMAPTHSPAVLMLAPLP